MSVQKEEAPTLPIEIVLAIAKNAHLFTLLAMRVTGHNFRDFIDVWLTADHIASLLNGLFENEKLRFQGFLEKCGYVIGDCDPNVFIGQYVFLAGISLRYCGKMTQFAQYVPHLNPNYVHDHTDIAYLDGFNRRFVHVLVAPENLPTTRGFLYVDRDFTIFDIDIAVTRDSIIRKGTLQNERAPSSNVTPVAIKSAKDANNSLFLTQIQHEMVILGQIKQKSRVSRLYTTEVMSVGKHEVAFRYYHLGDLDHFLDINHTRLSLPKRLLLCRSLLQCMSFIKNIGLLHRDIKASNVLVTDDGTLRLCDFALAKFQGDNNGIPYGTVLYQSPKILSYLAQFLQTGERSEDRYTLYDEVYSVILILYRILSGLLPYAEFDVLVNNIDLHEFNDYVQNGGRPHLPSSLNESIRAMIKNGWSIQEKDRPTYTEVQACITSELSEQYNISNIPQSNCCFKNL